MYHHGRFCVLSQGPGCSSLDGLFYGNDLDTKDKCIHEKRDIQLAIKYGQCATQKILRNIAASV